MIDVPAGWREQGGILVPPAVQMEFAPHPDAPLFTGKKESNDAIDELIAKRHEKLTDDLLELFRQAGLVSLWIFAKHILGASGPYTLLNDHLHMSMCNFRQRLLDSGARGAFLIPRSCLKSTIGTHGADTWEIIRNPNIQIGIVGATKPDARDFLSVIKANFEQNELFRLLYPEHAPQINSEGVVTQDNWTQDSIITPARTRYFQSGTVTVLGAGGSTAGKHFDLLNVDDLVSEKQLNADHVITSDMVKAKNWFMNNSDTLLVDPVHSRIFLAATRYAVDDAYDWIAEDAGPRSEGYFEELPDQCQPTEEGAWDVYYRQAVEYDQPLYPEKLPMTKLNEMKKKNFWGFMTQYNNNPYNASATELSEYEPGHFDLAYEGGEWVLYIGQFHEREKLFLKDLTVGIGIDPGASDRKKNDRTSRTAVVVMAKDWQERHFLIDLDAGYYETSRMIDGIFKLFTRYYPHVRRSNLEKMGAFAIFYNNVLRAQTDKQTYIGLNPITGGGDKDSKIRNFYQPLLDEQRFYINSKVRETFMEEMRVFPGGNRKDIMDAGTMATSGLGRPRSPQEQRNRDDFKNRRRQFASRITGA